MIRTALWVLLHVLCLGCLEVHVRYKDGLSVDLYNIWRRP